MIVPIDIINYIENEFPVEDWAINDIHIWPLIRVSLDAQIYAQSWCHNKAIQDKFCLVKRVFSVIYGFWKELFSYYVDFSANARPSPRVAAMILDHTTSRIFIERTYLNCFSGPIYNQLEGLHCETLLVELSPGNEYRIPRKEKSMFLQGKLNRLLIKSIFKKKFDKNYSLSGYSLASLCLKEKTGISMPTIRKLFERVSRIEILSEYWESVIRMYDMKVVFMVNYYSDIGMALNLACRRIGIPSVDIQHGVQGDFHPAYGRWNKMPPSGYSLLPSVFWVWSEEEKEAIERWNQSVKAFHRPFLGGNLWLEAWRDSNQPMAKSHDKVISSFIANGEAMQLLFTLQPQTEIPRHFLEYLRDFQAKFGIWVRLHPAMWKDKNRIKKIFRLYNIKNINLDVATTFPLPAILRNMDVHVTHHSSTVIEAAYFGVPSVLLAPDATQYYNNYIVQKMAFEAFSYNSLASHMAAIRNMKKFGKNRVIADKINKKFPTGELLKELGIF